VYFRGPWENLFRLWHHFNILLLLIASKTNLNLPYLTLPNQSTIPFPNPAGGNLSQPFPNLYFLCKHLMPDDFFKKLPKFGKINFGTAKVQY